MQSFPYSKHWLILSFLILLGTFFRFYNLDWGSPFYFHPDERNIASSISQLHFPTQMNPHFFAYGALPIYLIYFTGVIYNFFTMFHWFTPKILVEMRILLPYNVSFEQAILISRIFSASLSVFLIPLMYVIGKKIRNQNTGLLAAFLITTSVGCIQYAHFGTYEIWLTFFTTLFFFTCLGYWKHSSKWHLLSMGLLAGILVSSKISTLVLLPIPIALLFACASHRIYLSNAKKNRLVWESIHVTLSVLLYALLVAAIFVLTNPYTFLDPSAFWGAMHYESNVALGTEAVFYTGEFINTTPLFFQFMHVYPFLLNPLLAIFSILAFLFVSFQTIQKKSVPFLLLISFFIVLLFSQAFFYVKWSRYYVPTLPFLYLMISIFLTPLLAPFQRKRKSHSRSLIIILLALSSTLYASCFLIATYVEPDTRISATLWAKQHIHSNAPILSEVYDMGIVAFNSSFPNIKLFNFYDLDNRGPESTPQILAQNIASSDYIILPSQRIMKVRLLKPATFPIAHDFYTKLFSDTTTYQLIYQTPCDIFCSIAYTGDPVFNYEETADVFDRPVVYIFRKSK